MISDVNGFALGDGCSHDICEQVTQIEMEENILVCAEVCIHCGEVLEQKQFKLEPIDE